MCRRSAKVVCEAVVATFPNSQSLVSMPSPIPRPCFSIPAFRLITGPHGCVPPYFTNVLFLSPRRDLRVDDSRKEGKGIRSNGRFELVDVRKHLPPLQHHDNDAFLVLQEFQGKGWRRSGASLLVCHSTNGFGSVFQQILLTLFSSFRHASELHR